MTGGLGACPGWKLYLCSKAASGGGF